MWTAWIGLTLLVTLCLYSYGQARRILTAHFPAGSQVGESTGRWLIAHWDQALLPTLTGVLCVAFF